MPIQTTYRQWHQKVGRAKKWCNSYSLSVLRQRKIMAIVKSLRLCFGLNALSFAIPILMPFFVNLFFGVRCKKTFTICDKIHFSLKREFFGTIRYLHINISLRPEKHVSFDHRTPGVETATALRRRAFLTFFCSFFGRNSHAKYFFLT